MADPKPPTGYQKVVNKPVKAKEPPKPKMPNPSAKTRPMGAKTTKPPTRKQIAR